MANTKSALKRWRQSVKRRLRNRWVIGTTRTAVRSARASVDTGAETSETDVRAALGRLDWAVGKGALHRNAAARRKSRLMRRLNHALAERAAAPLATPEAALAEAKPKRATRSRTTTKKS